MGSSASDLDRALGQMVDCILAFDEIGLLDLVQHAWRQGWNLDDASDPNDSDPLRYALRACLIERMAEIWTAPPRSRDVKVPPWCAAVPPVEQPFSVIKSEFAEFFQNESQSQAFKARNIFAPEQYLFFL